MTAKKSVLREAEELRIGIENLIDTFGETDTDIPKYRLQELLDKTDARDALAFMVKQDHRVRAIVRDEMAKAATKKARS